MLKFVKKLSQKKGLPPGEVVYVGEKKAEKPVIRIIDYDEKRLEDREAAAIEECFSYRESPSVTWINISGIHETEIVEKIGGHYGIHPLVLEDIVSIGQRPKMEEHEDYIFIVLSMLYHSERRGGLHAEQISLLLGPNFVISFQEEEGDVFDAVRDRIRNSRGRIRKLGTDYLAYCLMDAVVDNYFLVLEKMAGQIEQMEEQLLGNVMPKTSHAIHAMKKDLIFLRKSIWPLREVILNFEKSELKLIQKSTRPYLRDAYDHTIQVIDTVESFRDMVSGMLDIYLSVVSNKMNEVMKVLTMFASIFIPLTFIVGIYGMNFDYLPGQHWLWSFSTTCFVMAALALSMLLYFKRKKWF